MRTLNREFLQHDRPTDVLAFALPGDTDESPGAVEVYICLDVAVTAAREYTTSVGYEVCLYAVHGFLHVSGFDDHDEADRVQMREAENAVMAELSARYDLPGLFGG